jgi:hypothetical protein
MILKILKGLILGFLSVAFVSYLAYLCASSHIQTVRVKNCENAAGQSLKALSKLVKDGWFQRKHNDVQVFSDGPCMFYTFYENPGALYFGQEMASGYIVGVAMSTADLHQFADTVSSHTDFQKMQDYLFARAKANPAPAHEF